MNLADLAVAEHRCAQDPWELSQLLDLLITDVTPRLILEIGTWYGGSLFAFGSTGADVIAYTLPETRDWLEDGHTYGAQVLYGNSHDAEAEGRILAAAAGRPVDFAFIDGDHSYEGCAADLELCLKLGAPVIGLHDVLAEGDPGVRQVWAEASSLWPHRLIGRAGLARPVGCGVLWPTS